MRIISGKYKNKTLESPKSDSTHPMGERERTAVFNMLGNLEGKTVLDLFAGTGALGIETLSRGAASCTFVENNAKAFACLKENLTGIDEECKAIKQDAYKFGSETKYDIVFVDPPYNQFSQDILEFKKLLAENGIMVVSSPEPINNGSRKYANCYITLLDCH